MKKKKSDEYFNYIAAGRLRFQGGIFTLVCGLVTVYYLLHYHTDSMVPQILFWVLWAGVMFVGFITALSTTIIKRVSTPYIGIFNVSLLLFIILFDGITSRWHIENVGIGLVTASFSIISSMTEPILHFNYQRLLKKPKKTEVA